MAVTIRGGEIGLVRLRVESRRVDATEEENWVEDCTPSGLLDGEVFVGGAEVIDTRLPLEELLEMAEEKVVVMGSEVTRLCLGLILENSVM
jgi:hypothetical protein